jgi:hypothetical protein
VITSHSDSPHRHDRITERPADGGTPGWQAIRASPPPNRSRHHRDEPHDVSGSPVTAFLIVLNRLVAGRPLAVPPAGTRTVTGLPCPVSAEATAMP